MITRRFMLRAFGASLGIVLLLLAASGVYIRAESNKAVSEDSRVWEADIREFEVDAKINQPPPHAVLFLGSSSIRLWHSLAEDMHPIPVIQRGFGGARLNDLLYYTERLVNVPSPRAIVVFAGTNDITPSAAKAPQELLTSYQKFVAQVRSALPAVPIYYIAITPSPRRWQVWPIVQRANRLIQQYTGSDEFLHYIDTGPALLDSYGEPDEDHYVFDGLHLSDSGYNIWREIIYSRLLLDFPMYRANQ